MNSRPAASAICVIATMSSQFARQRSGARLIVKPPSQLALKTPSLNLFGPNSGLFARDGGVLQHLDQLRLQIGTLRQVRVYRMVGAGAAGEQDAAFASRTREAEGYLSG